MKYRGITTKKMSDGSTAIMVRFKYKGKVYPIKNFTKLYGCRTQTQAFEELQDIKLKLSKGIDVFNKMGDTLDETFQNILNEKVNNDEVKLSTKETYEKHYNTYIKKDLGKYDIANINQVMLEKSFNKIKHLSLSLQKMYISILLPIFQDSVEKRFIEENIVLKLKVSNKPLVQKETLDKRVNESYISIVTKLYKAIKVYKAWYRNKKNEEEVKAFFYMVLLTAHRYGEILKLKREYVDIDKKLIYAPKEITKSRRLYIYPLPDEVIDYIKQKKDKELLFPNLNYKAMASMFKTLLKRAEIDLVPSQTMTIHDTRNLMLNIMIKELRIESMLADECLEHSHKGVIAHYISFNQEDKNRAYNKYWELIRNKAS